MTPLPFTFLFTFSPCFQNYKIEESVWRHLNSLSGNFPPRTVIRWGSYCSIWWSEKFSLLLSFSNFNIAMWNAKLLLNANSKSWSNTNAKSLLKTKRELNVQYKGLHCNKPIQKSINVSQVYLGERREPTKGMDYLS